MPQPIEVPLPSIEEVITSMPQPIEVPSLEEVTTATPQRAEVPSIEEVEVDILNSLERDPGKRPPIWKYPPNQVDQIRRANTESLYEMGSISNPFKRLSFVW
jgi:hypothetical protein